MTNRPRLCFVVTSAVTATTFLKGYLRYLRKDGWDVVLICSDGPGLREFAASESVTVHAIDMARDPAPLRDIRALFKMLLLLRKLHPNVLVYATPKASLIASVAGRFCRVPRRVYELWGLRLETTSGFQRQVLGLLEWLTAKMSSIVVANSASLANRARQLRLNAGRDVITPGSGSSHGVDVDYFNRATQMSPLDLETQKALEKSELPVIGFIGRLHPDKGLDTLIEALLICSKQGIKLQALIVGGDEGAVTTEVLNKLKDQMPVTVTGHVTDPRPYIVAMDALVLVSKREGFPNVVLEAAALEVPAIVSDSTGCIDTVDDGKTGVIVPVEDPEALAKAISIALNDPNWRMMGIAARDRVLREFTQDRVWKLHNEIIKNELGVGVDGSQR